MALIGKTPRGAHAANGRASQRSAGGQTGRQPRANAAAGEAFDLNQTSQQAATPAAAQGRYGRGDENAVAMPEGNTPAARNAARRQRAQQAQAQAIDNGQFVATQATGSYADLAMPDAQPNKLGPVVISLRNVTKVYPAQPNKPALNGLTLDIRAGEFLFLVGHSGSGKSTFIRMLNREVVPTSGELMVAGENLRTIRNWRIPYLRRNVGCVFQDFKLLPNKTAFENVAFALEVIGKSRHVVETQVPEVLRLVGLEEKMDKLPDQLSGGEQQRVSIARSIVNRPPILICDEPTGNLDPQTSLGIMRLLERINRTGTTVLVATHDREMVDQMRRRVLALENGVLVRDQKKGVYGYDV